MHMIAVLFMVTHYIGVVDATTLDEIVAAVDANVYSINSGSAIYGDIARTCG